MPVLTLDLDADTAAGEAQVFELDIAILDKLGPGLELTGLPARIVEELIEEYHRSRDNPVAKAFEDRLGRGIHVRVDVDERTWARMGLAERGQGRVEPPLDPGSSDMAR